MLWLLPMPYLFEHTLQRQILDKSMSTKIRNINWESGPKLKLTLQSREEIKSLYGWSVKHERNNVSISTDFLIQYDSISTLSIRIKILLSMICSQFHPVQVCVIKKLRIGLTRFDTVHWKLITFEKNFHDKYNKLFKIFLNKFR